MEQQQVPPEYGILARGIKRKYRGLVDQDLHRTVHGRVVTNALTEAVGCGITDEDTAVRDGRMARLFGITGMCRDALQLARIRLKSANAIALLDPSRKLRKDALQGDKLLHVLYVWETMTRPEPAMGQVVRIRCGVGEYEKHALHWQEKRTADLYLSLVEAFGAVCSLSQFYKERPVYVRKPRKESSLCPYCYVMKLMMIAYAQLIEDVRAASNSCKCSFCAFHKAEATAGQKVKRHYRDLFDAMFCAKRPAPASSGFHGAYPCYHPSCIMEHLKPADQTFIKSKLPGIIGCSDCGTYMLFGGSDCKFMQSETARVYWQHQITIARTGKSEKEGKTRDMLDWTSSSRVDFETAFTEQFSIQVNHRHRTDWQDAYAEILYRTPRASRTVLAMDFGMSWEMIRYQEMKQELFQHESVSIHSCCTYSEW